MSFQKLKVGDQIIVTKGKDAGKQGTILSVKKDKISLVPIKVLVEGINLATKHVKPNPNTGQQGGLIKKEMPLAISNVAIYNPDSSKADRVSIKMLEDGKKIRVFTSTGEKIPEPAAK